MHTKPKIDVIVIGGGHAGTEAAAASARFGASTLLITHRADRIGTMSCNPAIGGLGKGHLVREIDALDGVMGLAADQAGIQFRMLNASKGPAVRGPRAQADRNLYAKAVQDLLAQYSNLEILEAEVCGILTDGQRHVSGVKLVDGREVACGSIVLTTGTFLHGIIHLGDESWSAGRIDDPAAVALAQSLRFMDFSIGRLKTGTPPRLDGRTIDLDSCTRQDGDENPIPFSWLTDRITIPQRACHVTETNTSTHEIIARNFMRAPVFSGQISSRGPRYCPSIEDKVSRFPDRSTHRIFLEPEGLETHTVYPNGISTSLPRGVQDELVASIRGLEHARILRHGYAIEYDFVDPRELYHSLETRRLNGFFLAGQINGTTGYEEAAGQGLVAGLNAARKAAGMQCVSFARTDSYIGVMIDDLVTRGTEEPYRMFTSRAEYRLLLRTDNADLRLTSLGRSYGCVRDPRWNAYSKRKAEVDRVFADARIMKAPPSRVRSVGIPANNDGRKRDVFDLFALPDVTRERLTQLWPDIGEWPQHAYEQVAVAGRYAGYLRRMESDIAAFRRDEAIRLPESLDYGRIGGLSNEVRDKLVHQRPATLGQASRLPGITPAALQAVLSHVRRCAA